MRRRDDHGLMRALAGVHYEVHDGPWNWRSSDNLEDVFILLDGR